jgi:hypothetical protein
VPRYYASSGRVMAAGRVAWPRLHDNGVAGNARTWSRGRNHGTRSLGTLVYASVRQGPVIARVSPLCWMLTSSVEPSGVNVAPANSPFAWLFASV